MSGGFFINKLGRKGTMMYNSVFFALSYLCLAAAQNVWMLFVGRFLSGMASGKDLFRNGQSTTQTCVLPVYFPVDLLLP